MFASDTVGFYRGWHIIYFNESNPLCIMRMAYYLMEFKWHQFKASPSNFGIVFVLVAAHGFDTYTIIWVRTTDTTVITEEDIERLLPICKILFNLHCTENLLYLFEIFLRRDRARWVLNIHRQKQRQMQK